MNQAPHKVHRQHIAHAGVPAWACLTSPAVIWDRRPVLQRRTQAAVITAAHEQHSMPVRQITCLYDNSLFYFLYGAAGGCVLCK